MARRIHGVGQMASVAVAVALGAAVGCGDGFASADCHESHTCEAAAGEGGAADGNGAAAGAGRGGSDTPALGGAGGADALAGAGGADGECKVDLDCSNDIAEDGAEICNAGVCGAGNPPPTIKSFSPESDKVDVEPDTSIVIEFSEPLDPKTVNETTIQLLDGPTVVKGKVTYAAKKVTFSPDEPLALQVSYKLLVKALVTDDGGAPLAADQSSTFQVRDGEWASTVVVRDVLSVADTLPMTSTGRTLLAWSGNGDDTCPATARWFLRGEAQGMAATFPTGEPDSCEFISSAGNATGIAALVWNSSTAYQGIVVQQNLSGQWLPKGKLVSDNVSANLLRLAVAPSGTTTLFEGDSSIGSLARTTNAAGDWSAASTSLSAYGPISRTSVVFDKAERGWAVWRAIDWPARAERVVATRLATAGGKWAPATDLPDSVAVPPTPETGKPLGGSPVVAVDGQGDALVLWVAGGDRGELMANRFTKSAWSKPQLVSGVLDIDVFDEPPSLVFDGTAFVAAWSAQEAGERWVYTARYDLTTGWGAYQRQQTNAADETSAQKMPRLVTDGRGNLLLVYATGTEPSYSLLYQRYVNDAWGSIKPLPKASPSTASLEYDELTLSMSANGLAALAWTDRDLINSHYITAIHLSSFF